MATARIFRAITETLEREAARFEGRFHRLSYGELCRQPIDTVKNLAAKLGLPWTPEFEATVPTDLKSADFKWRERLDPSLVERLRSEAADFFARYEEP